MERSVVEDERESTCCCKMEDFNKELRGIVPLKYLGHSCLEYDVNSARMMRKLGLEGREMARDRERSRLTSYNLVL